MSCTRNDLIWIRSGMLSSLVGLRTVFRKLILMKLSAKGTELIIKNELNVITIMIYDDRFLSYVDLLGTTYSSPSLATGFGNHLAQPLLRRALEKLGPEGHELLEEKDARSIMETAMKVLFYRDARSLNKFQIATVTNRGVEVGEPIAAPTEWGFAEGGTWLCFQFSCSKIQH